MLFYSDSTDGQRGVDFLIRQELEQHIVQIKSLSDRIAKAIIKFHSNNCFVIVQVYTPTKIEQFYSKFTETIFPYLNNQQFNLRILGYFNSQIAQKFPEECKYIDKITLVVKEIVEIGGSYDLLKKMN